MFIIYFFVGIKFATNGCIFFFCKFRIFLTLTKEEVNNFQILSIKKFQVLANPFHVCVPVKLTNMWLLIYLKLIVLLYLPARIEDAYWNLRNTEKRSTKKPRNASKLEDSNGVNGVEQCATEPQSEVTTENSAGPSPSTTLSDKVSFKKENFVLQKYPMKDNCYDTIIW